jgi:hypothetical protein
VGNHDYCAISETPTRDRFGAVGLALAVGVMNFFAAVAATLVFTDLPAAPDGAFVPAVFPWYYLSAGAETPSAFLVPLSGIGKGGGRATLLSGFALMGFLFADQVMTPTAIRGPNAQHSWVASPGRRFRRLPSLGVLVKALQWVTALTAFVLVVT